MEGFENAPMLRLTVIAVSALLAASASANVVSDMRVVGDSERTRFVVDLEKSPDFNVLRLANPYRLVIDLASPTVFDPVWPALKAGVLTTRRWGRRKPGRGAACGPPTFVPSMAAGQATGVRATTGSEA